MLLFPLLASLFTPLLVLVQPSFQVADVTGTAFYPLPEHKQHPRDVDNAKKHLSEFNWSNFDDAYRRNFTLFAYFYSPNCVECDRGLIAVAKAKKKLESKSLPVNIGYVDVTKYPEVSEKLGIFYFPRYLFFAKGRRVDYKQGRSGSLIAEWIKHRILNPSLHADNREEVPELKRKLTRFFFYVGFNDPCYDAYRHVASGYAQHGVNFAHTFDRDKIANQNGIYFHDTNEGTFDQLNGPFFEDHKLMMFINRYSQLLRSMPDYIMDRIWIHDKVFFIMVYPDTDEERGAQISMWHAAQYVMHDITCVYVPIKYTENMKMVMEDIGVINPDSPAVRIVEITKEGEWKVYQMRKKYHETTLRTFYEQWKAKELTPFYKSERPPRQTDDLIIKLVGKNFDKYVLNEKIDVLAFFYKADHCTLCVRLEKILRVVAKVYSGTEHLRIVKIDARKNWGPRIPVRHYPQLQMFIRGRKQYPTQFRSILTAKELCQWISKVLKIENPYDSIPLEVLQDL